MRFPLGMKAIAHTANWSCPRAPDPKGLHVVPPIRAMLCACTPSMTVNIPQAIRSPLGAVAIVRMYGSVPDPSADHVEPWIIAIAAVASPPVYWKTPPAIRSPLAQALSAETVPPGSELYVSQFPANTAIVWEPV